MPRLLTFADLLGPGRLPQTFSYAVAPGSELASARHAVAVVEGAAAGSDGSGMVGNTNQRIAMTLGSGGENGPAHGPAHGP